jgi:hypothetical protein
MADSLAEIYNNTLTEADFSNGEATIVTTNGATSHIIKSVQVIEGNADIPLAGTLTVNGFDVAALTGNSSGIEIVAPNSTVKVKVASDRFPLIYSDATFISQRSTTTTNNMTEASIAGNPLDDFLFDTANIGYSYTLNDTKRIFVPDLGPDNNSITILSDSSRSGTQLFVKDSAGNNLATQGDTGKPGWFDGVRYAYYFNRDNNKLHRVDTFTGTDDSTFATISQSSSPSYPAMFGIKDKYLFFWVNDGGSGTSFYDFTTNTVGVLSTSHANQVFTNLDKNFFSVIRSDGTIVFIVLDSNTNVKFWTANRSDFGTANIGNLTFNNYTELSPDGTSEQFSAYLAGHASVGSKLYYINQDNYLASWDFETDTPVHTVEYSGSMSFYGSKHVSVRYSEPDAGTIAARDYGVMPSLSLRVTGVTTT